MKHPNKYGKFYDFYSIKNPKIERYIHRKLTPLKESLEKCETRKQFANIVKNLIISDSSCDVFILRQYMKNDPFPTMIYKGRRPKWSKILIKNT